jgi:hypothetical protein
MCWPGRWRPVRVQSVLVLKLSALGSIQVRTDLNVSGPEVLLWEGRSSSQGLPISAGIGGPPTANESCLK